MLLRPKSGLSVLRGVGPKRAAALARAGFTSVVDLLYHLPLRYEDRRHVSRVADVALPGNYTLCGHLLEVRRIFTRRRSLRIVRGTFEDESGRLPVVWFNQPYLATQVGDRCEYQVHGLVRARGEGLELLNPSVERVEAVETGGILAVYPAIDDVGPKVVGHLLRGLVENLDFDEWIDEPLAPEVLQRYDLPTLAEALRGVHRPPQDADVDALNEHQSASHRRLIYGELLDLRLRVEAARHRLPRLAADLIPPCRFDLPRGLR